MELTQTQKIEFFKRGYLVIPQAVPAVNVHAALRAINESVGDGSGRWLSAWELLRLLVRRRTRKYCQELMQEPVIMDLIYQTPAWTIAESAIGRGNVRPVSVSQIPLRFPGEELASSPAVPHLDGMHSPTNGLPKGEVRTFTALVGILLSDLPTPDAGNFTVWPGTHQQYEQYFRKHTPQSLLNGMPPIELPAPQQITGKAGDLVFCHYLLAHGVAPNLSPHIRYAVFFRLSHVEHESHKWETLTDIWLEWQGMRELAESLNRLAAA
jgi:hypothetical protein